MPGVVKSITTVNGLVQAMLGGSVATADLDATLQAAVTAIATNTAAIATNTADIATNAAAIAGLGTASTLTFSTDGTLSANSDALIPTQKAVKTYADQLLAAVDAMVFKGVVDCSANPNYPAADAGWTYRVSVAGKIGGGSGLNVQVGDFLVCIVDGSASGNQATVGANWGIAQANIDGAVIGPTSAVNNRVAFFDGTSGVLIKDSGLTLSGTNTGDQTITLTGQVTGSGTGSFATTLATAQPDVHTWALAQTFTVAPVFTNQSGTRTALGLGTLATQSGTFSGTSSGTNTGDQTITLTGDVTGSGTGSFAATIAALNLQTSAEVGFMTADDDLLFGYDFAAGANRVFPVSRLAAVGGYPFCGRLGPTSSPFILGNAPIISTLYLWAVNGDLLALYDGTRWVNWRIPAQIGIILTGLTASRGYDVWAFINTATPSSTNTGTDIVTWGADPGWQTGAHVRVASTGGGLTAGTTYFYNRASSTTGSFHLTIGSSLIASSKVDLTANITQAVTGVSMELLVWTSGTARATALTTQNGVYVKTGDATRRYVGSFYTSSTTTTEDTASQRFLWNYYNRIEKPVAVQEVTDSWTYSSTTIRQMNGATGNKVEVFCGLTDDMAEIFTQVGVLEQSAGGGGSANGIGIDSTTVNSAQLSSITYWTPAGNLLHTLQASYRGNLGLGYHYAAALEWVTVAAVVSTFYGDAGDATRYYNGISGSIWC